MKSLAATGFFILGISLCLHIVFGQEEKIPSLDVLVPRIQQENFQLNPSKKHYDLVIALPSLDTRREHVELRGSNPSELELHVMGEIYTHYKAGLLHTTYDAGKDGNVVKYKYEKVLFFQLSPGALKTAAG